MQTPIWFIGSGFIGGNMAKNFQERNYKTVQYSLEEPFKYNRYKLRSCEVVFVAVPTPTVWRKFDGSILRQVILEDTFPDQKIIIKSTVPIGTTDTLQDLVPDRFLFHSAEFLTEKNAKYDVDFPQRNILGHTAKSEPYTAEILRIFPTSKHHIICKATESEAGKYMSNFLLAGKVILANIMYDLCEKYRVEYEKVRHIAGTDDRIGPSHLQVEHEWGRGANGHCFPKDLSALHEMYAWYIYEWDMFLEALEQYNLALNLNTDKNPAIMREIFGLDKK